MTTRLLIPLAIALAACGSSTSGSSATSSGSSAATTTATGGASHGSSSGGGTTGSGAGSTSSSSGATTASGTAGSTSTSGSTGTTGRSFPDTSSSIGIISDQLPGGMSSAQQQFAATHYLGSQKLTLDISRPLRAINPAFLVLHYHLCMWQSAQGVDFILDGENWGNDYDTVTTHEDWFWHDTAGDRVASVNDGKWLMNVSNPDFQAYWSSALIQQAQAGGYDGVFFDSASPALLNFEAQAPPDPQLQGTNASTQPQPELGGATWSSAWADWIQGLDAQLAAQGLALIPNTGDFTTSWDTTDYGRSAGIFSENFASPSFAEGDWQASTTELIKLAAADKIIMEQNYLDDPGDLALRRYYLANYLLVKNRRSYLFYFASSTLEWYPEWSIDLGAPTNTATTSVSELLQGGVYRRDFAHGVALVNPSGADVQVDLGGTFQRVEPSGGGAVPNDGSTPGSVGTTAVTSINVPARGAEILLR